MRLYLPHIHYTVYIRRFKSHPFRKDAHAYVEHQDSNTCIMHLPPKQAPGDLVHEVVHVLQFICEDRNMDFTLEREHMAYLAQHITGKISGYHYE